MSVTKQRSVSSIYSFDDLLNKLSGKDYAVAKKLSDTLTETCKTLPMKSSAQQIEAPPTVAPVASSTSIKYQKLLMFSLITLIVVKSILM